MNKLSPAEYAQLKQKQEKEAFAILDQQTIKCMESDKEFTRLLNLSAAHISTSVSNTLLVMGQISDATPELTAVNSIDEWQKRNISIKEDKNGYKPSGIYLFYENGVYETDDGELRTRYKVCKGYDASQTTNPEYARAVMQNARPINVYLNTSDIIQTKGLALINSSPIKCVVWGPNKLIDDHENISEEVGVQYIPETKAIIIRSLPRNDWFFRVSYEIAMGMYHKREGSQFKRQNHSFEAAIVAYLLCRYANIDTSNYRISVNNMRDTFKHPATFRYWVTGCLEMAHELAFRLNNKLKDYNKPKEQVDVRMQR